MTSARFAIINSKIMLYNVDSAHIHRCLSPSSVALSDMEKNSKRLSSKSYVWKEITTLFFT